MKRQAIIILLIVIMSGCGSSAKFYPDSFEVGSPNKTANLRHTPVYIYPPRFDQTKIKLIKNALGRNFDLGHSFTVKYRQMATEVLNRKGISVTNNNGRSTPVLRCRFGAEEWESSQTGKISYFLTSYCSIGLSGRQYYSGYGNETNEKGILGKVLVTYATAGLAGYAMVAGSDDIRDTISSALGGLDKLLKGQPAKNKAIFVDVYGSDDGIREGRKTDYDQAFSDAKKNAAQQLGATVISKQKMTSKYSTDSKNNSYFSDTISDETSIEIEAILLPNYTIEQLGYDQDGYFIVRLKGKIIAN